MQADQLTISDALLSKGNREEHQGHNVLWHIALLPSLRRKLGKTVQALQEAHEYTKANLRAKVEHPFRVIKRQFGYTKVRYRGLTKNNAQLFTLSNLWMARRHLMGEVRP